MTWLLLILVITLLGIIVETFARGVLLRWLPIGVTVVNIPLFIVQLVTGELQTTSVFSLTLLSAFLASITLFIGCTASIYSLGYVQSHLQEVEGSGSRQARSYYVLFMAFYFSLLVATLLNNILLTWGAIELTALSSVLLVDWNHTRLTHEASWKYIVIMETAGLLALFGLLLLLASTGTPVAAATWTNLAQAADSLTPEVQRIAFVFVLVGFGSKAGLVPFNFWLPDAHSQAPSPISAMLSAIKLNTAMYGIVQMQKVILAGGQGRFADHTLLTVGFVTVAVSTLMTVYQRDFKRLFAYSSSENLGLVAIGFSLGPIGMLGAYLQMANHSLIKSMLFYHTGELHRIWGSNDMRGLSGIAQILPRTGRSLVLGMLAIAGAPPFGLFLGEFFIVFDLLKHSSTWLAVLLLLLLAILFANFLRYALSLGYGETSSRLLRHGVPIEPATVLLPTAGHLLASLALGLILPVIVVGLHLTGIS